MFFFALLLALLATNLAVGSVFDTVAILVVMAALYAVYAARHATLPVPVYWSWGFAALCALLAIQIALGRFATWKLALAPFAAIVTVAGAVFVLPRVIPFRTFCRVGALLLAVAMTALQGGVPEQPFGTGIGPALTAGLLGVVACLGTLSLFDREGNPFDLVLSMLAGWSVVILLQRAVAVVLVAGITLYILDTRVSRRAMSITVTAGALALIGFVVAVIALPATWVGELPLTSRQWLWRGTWAAITQSPVAFLSGVGYVSAKEYLGAFVPRWMNNLHGPHNGYLLVWLRAGVLAAILHVAFIWGSIAIGLRRHAPPELLAATVALAVDMTVANFMLISVTPRSVLLAALCGYLLRDHADRWTTLDLTPFKHRIRAVTPDVSYQAD